jgi:hypothetical protein
VTVTERLDGVGSAPPRRAEDDFYAGNDLTPFIPERLARGFERRRRSWSPVDTVAAWLVGIHLLVLLVIVGRGALYLDDLRAQGYALNQPFWQFIAGSNGTHFAPVPRILDWVQSRAFPLEHGPAVVVTLVVRLLLAIGGWRLLRRLFGPRPGILVPFALLLFTPALLPATTWYRQSITVVACTVAMVWALDAQLRWILYRRRADLAAAVAATAVGVGCYEKGAAIPVILAGVSLALFLRRPGSDYRTPDRTGLERPLRAALAGVALSAVVVAIFLVVYRSGPYDQGGRSSPSLLDVLHLGWDTGARTVVPLLFGGPYHWSYPSPYAGVAHISTTAIVFCLVLVLVGLAVAVRRGAERAVRGVIVLFAWALPSAGIVALGRFDSLQLVLADAARLWADLVPGFLLAGSLAVLPWAVGVCRSAPSTPIDDGTPLADDGTTPADDGTAPAGIRPHRASDRNGAPIELTVPAIAAGLVMVLILGGSAYSSVTYARKWWDNPTGAWVANARTSLQNAEPYPRTLATPLPEAVMPAWVSAQFPSSAPLLLLLRPDIRFHDGDGDAKVMSAAGVRSPYLPGLLAQTKEVPLCLAAIPIGAKQPTSVKLTRTALYVPGAQVEVGVLLAETTKVEVTVLTPEGKALTPQRFSDDELPQGPHTVRVPVPFGQAVARVLVKTNATNISCITYARVWAPLS